jgi:branched-chain amino acid transport system substrate-binding protein
MEGPWGTGSTKTVELIFNDKVMAILGSHDGKNAHLVEQVSAKARIVFLSAWASDPTLTQAYIPWCYNCVPNDLQQAEAIVNEVYLKRKYKQVAVITDKGYDSKMSLNSLIKKAKIAGETDPLQFFCDIRSNDINLLSDQIMNSGINCIVVYGSGGNSGKIIEQLNQKKLNQEIFSSISMLNDSGPSNLRLKNLERTVFISSGHWFTPDGLLFSREFEQKYGYIPGPVAAYAYDGMNLIIEAIRKAGYESEKIREVMSKIKYKGVTGWIEFDSMGNRSWKGEFITIKDGRLVVAK